MRGRTDEDSTQLCAGSIYLRRPRLGLLRSEAVLPLRPQRLASSTWTRSKMRNA